MFTLPNVLIEYMCTQEVFGFAAQMHGKITFLPLVHMFLALFYSALHSFLAQVAKNSICTECKKEKSTK